MPLQLRVMMRILCPRPAAQSYAWPRGSCMRSHQKVFIEMILAKQVLRFGDFTLKSGRTSPYFFNAGLINDGVSLARLGNCYAEAILEAGTAFDMLFGPAYKGIPLATATAVAFAERHRRNVPFAYNRKEAKAHGEGGTVAGDRKSTRLNSSHSQ